MELVRLPAFGLNSGEDSDENARPDGQGEITLEDDSTYGGEFFDTDGDGFVDKSRPFRGQSAAGGEYGQTDGKKRYAIGVRVNIQAQ